VRKKPQRVHLNLLQGCPLYTVYHVSEPI